METEMCWTCLWKCESALHMNPLETCKAYKWLPCELNWLILFWQTETSRCQFWMLKRQKKKKILIGHRVLFCKAMYSIAPNLKWLPTDSSLKKKRKRKKCPCNLYSSRSGENHRTVLCWRKLMLYLISVPCESPGVRLSRRSRDR